MYGKLFVQMYDGTLGTVGPWQALIVFQQFIILADKDGSVDMTPEAIARRTTLPLELIKQGITALLLPDPHSRTPDEDGRRLVPLADSREWGWRVVNYQKYRSIRTADDRREYMRQYMREKRASVSTVNNVSPKQPIAYVEAKVDVDVEVKAKARTSNPLSADADVVAVFQHWQQVHGHPLAKLGDKKTKRYRAIAGRLKEGYTVAQLLRAVDGCKKSPHHQGENDRHEVYDDIELICRDAAHVDKFIRFADAKASGLSSAGRKAVSAGEAWLATQEAADATQ